MSDELPQVWIDETKLRKRSRRDFILFGAGALAAAAGMWWIAPVSSKKRVLGEHVHDREALAILPFQVNAGRFVIPYYVMTRDATQSLVPEPFTISLEGVNAASVRVSAYDPLNDRVVPVTVNNGFDSGDTIAVMVNVADYPYLLIVDDGNGTG